ncbi:MAG: putative sigma-54 modulation protein [Congregibacter sp.]|jgi:ribosomal subunit interface protein
MLVHIQSRHFSLSAALNKYVKTKLQVMMGRYEAKIISLNVSLFDINGPKGGEDKCCKIIVKINGTSSIVVQETAADLYDAINTCSRRARRAVKRQLSVHIRTRTKINDVLLPTDEALDLQNTTY